jgi:uncharacterized membrane-anchored protein
MTQLLSILLSLSPEAIEALEIFGGAMAIGLIALVLGGLYLFFIRFFIAYRMATNRKRNALIWVLLSVFVSPLGVWITLAVMGDKKEGESEWL